MRYLVGYAADDHGREALELGAWLAGRHGAELTIGYAVPEEFPIASRADARSSFPPEFHERVRGWLDEAVRWLAAERAVTAEPRMVAAPSAARGLVALAEEVGAGMIVLGSSRTSPLRHFSVGTVSGQLLHSSPLALALAPRGLALSVAQPVRRVWCGQAGTARSHEALTAAVQLARRAQAPLRLVTFVVPDGVWHLPRADAEQVVTRHRERAEQLLAEAAKAARAQLGPDGELDTMVAEGTDVDAAFAQLAPDRPGRDGDLLVLGSSDAGQLERVFFGGTASRLLRHCPWPVVAVPRGGSAAALDITGRFAPVNVDSEVETGGPS